MLNVIELKTAIKELKRFNQQKIQTVHSFIIVLQIFVHNRIFYIVVASPHRN